MRPNWFLNPSFLTCCKLILHYFKLLHYNVVSSWHNGGMTGTQWTMRSNQSEHAENQRKNMFSTKAPLDSPFITCSYWKPMSINLSLTLWSCVQLKELLPFCTDVFALRLFTMFSGNENFIVPGSTLMLPSWPKIQKTLGTRFSMTSMCKIGQWGACYT